MPDSRAVAYERKWRRRATSVRWLVFASAAFQLAVWILLRISDPCDRYVQGDFLSAYFLALLIHACLVVPAVVSVLILFSGERTRLGYATLGAAIVFPMAVFALFAHTGLCIVG